MRQVLDRHKMTNKKEHIRVSKQLTSWVTAGNWSSPEIVSQLRNVFPFKELEDDGADQSNRAEVMKCFWPIENWVRGFESHSKYRNIFSFLVSLLSCVSSGIMTGWSTVGRAILFACIYWFGLDIREYGHGDSLRWPRDTLYPQKLALTSPTIGCRSVGIVCGLRLRSLFILIVPY
jgi:hypothetical protein